MPDNASLLTGFRGTAAEVSALAQRLTHATHYRPTVFTKAHMKHGFELLLRHQSSDVEIDRWSINDVHKATGIDPSTIREMRIALIMLDLLPYRADVFSKHHVKAMWDALNHADNADKSHEDIAGQNNWNVTTLRYYARVGRFVGEVPFRHLTKTRRVDGLSDARMALLGADTPEADIALKPELYESLSTMLVRYTDEDGYIEDRSIKKIAACLDISSSIVSQLRIGLVTLGKLPEQKLFDKVTMLAMWDVLQNNHSCSEKELSQTHGWDHEQFLRAARIGRLAGKVTSRIEFKKAEWLPKLLDYMRTHKVRPSTAAAELGIDPDRARTWMRKRGSTQQTRINSQLTILTAIITHASGNDLTNEELGVKLRVSGATIAKYLDKIIARLTGSDKPQDKVKLDALQPRIERMNAAKARKALTRAIKAAAKPADPQ